MEVKKDLNNTQRKVLEEIYVNKVVRVKQDYEQKRRKDREALCDEVFRAFLKTPAGKAIKKAIDNIQSVIENNKEAINRESVCISGLNRAFDVNLSIEFAPYSSRLHPVVKAFDQETNKRVLLFENVRDEVRAKVWGVNTSYQDIENEVQTLIEKALGDE